MRRIFFSYLLALLALPLAAQAQPKPIKIWPHLAPGSESTQNKEKWKGRSSVTNVYQPDLTAFAPGRGSLAPAPAVVVLPGGGYRQVVMKKEGYRVAEWLNANGIAAFVLKYRLDRSAALRDAQRAVSFLRRNAKRFNVDEHKIGVLGFSAGAHLAGNLALNHASRKAMVDATDEASSRPDFWVGVYGRYQGLYSETGLIPPAADVAPAFLVHAANDSKVPVLESLKLYAALKKKGVPAELHVYEKGEHGFAVEKSRGPHTTSTVESWTARCLEWLKLRGVL